MGDVKDQMTPTPSADNKEGGLLGLFSRRKDKPKEELKFADHIELAYAKVEEAIVTKEVDLKHEKGSEVENTKKLAALRTMLFHLDQIAEIASQTWGAK